MAKTAKQIENENAAADIAKDVVNVRITKLGAGKVSNGVHHPQLGDELYEANETPTLPRVVALALEERGFAEIQEPEAKKAS